MSQLRLNPLTGRWVTVASERAGRPGDLISRQLRVESDPDRACPFCPGNEEATPPALETYGPNGGWLVRVVPNLYPAFEGHDPLRVQNLGPVFTQADASGVHEVLVFSPDHDGTWADLDDKQAGLAMAAIRDRMEDHARRSTVRYTQAIVNMGREAGASLDHPHGQLLGVPFVPGEIAEEEAGFRRFEGSCLLCTMLEAEVRAGHRLVLEDERVVVVCPFWSGAPYEMLVLPRSHEVHLEDSQPADIVAVGRALRDALRLLRTKVGDIAYNLVFHTAPHHHEGPFHWHVHVVPRLTSLAGFEQGTGVLINIVPPELAAQHLTGG
jgi:UDPglucose--hexose-1-phosphate uridylyltransferase